MNQPKTKRKTNKKLIILVPVGILLVLALAVAFSLPKPLQINNTAYNLAQIADGVYQGECSNGLVKAVVTVTIQNHAIVQVQLLQHRNGMGAPAEAITALVETAQTLDVDVVAGATASSLTILKAIENALISAM